MDTNKRNHQEAQDIRLDTPGEANREKHINFLEEEENNSQRSGSDVVDDFAAERRRQWEEGIAEGKKARENGE
ncbi:MAG TPA: hypothetical protein VEX63_08105 [Flavisolibacter sp.]|jgi:hypothetical protein|nr:hypothetical protein [Flavisolibacter sp.]